MGCPHVTDDLGAKTALMPEVAQGLRRAESAPTETEIVADEHRASRERTDEHFVDEVRRLRRARFVEAQHEGGIDPRVGK